MNKKVKTNCYKKKIKIYYQHVFIDLGFSFCSNTTTTEILITYEKYYKNAEILFFFNNDNWKKNLIQQG